MAIRKTPPLAVERLEDGRRQLTRDLVVNSRGRDIRVPAGFKTDFSSIPFGFKSLIPWNKVDVAGVVHDWLFATALVPWAESNAIWKDVAQSGNPKANWLQAQAGYLGLMAGSWVVWNKWRRGDLGKDQDIDALIKKSICPIKRSDND